MSKRSEQMVALCLDGAEPVYGEIRQSIITAKQTVFRAVNSAMVMIYWEIGQKIDLACEGKRAEYGKGLLSMLSERLTAEFGKGYSIAGLRNMRQFYRCYSIRSALRSELSWTHYRLLMRVSDHKAREFYTSECASAGWSSRELERQITTFAYQRTLAVRDSAEKLPSPAKQES